jgi:hypothetical protein
MKAVFLILGMFFVFGCLESPEPAACTAEAKLCPDGSYVGRVPPDCEFAPCPEVRSCDATTPCPEGYECYKFEDEDSPICYIGTNPCERCPSRMCNIAESYPMQVFCINETEAVCEDLCGDGICQEIVCMAIGCPCAETFETCPQDCGGPETEPETEVEAEPETTNELDLQYCDDAECPEGYSCKLLQKEDRPVCVPNEDIFSNCDMCSSGKCYIYSYMPLALKCLAEES